MTLSIITINLNNAVGLKKTIRSVLAQTYRDIEYVIIDGASSDNSVGIIRDFEHQFSRRLRWISEPDTGIYNAMNKGIKMSNGDYIQILNSGDILAADDVTERMFNILEKQDDSHIPILSGNMMKVKRNGKLYRDTCLGARTKRIKPVQAREIECSMYDFIHGTINHDPTYIRADLFEKYGLYDEQLKIVSDWKWFVNSVIFGGEKVFYVPIDVTVFDMTGISETNLSAREEERHNELKKMLPNTILKDYDKWHYPISQVKRLKNHHMWSIVCFIERVLFKLEKWSVIQR